MDVIITAPQTNNQVVTDYILHNSGGLENSRGVTDSVNLWKDHLFYKNLCMSEIFTYLDEPVFIKKC